MEPLIRYISKNKPLQEQIVTSEDDALIEATYRLFLHYGVPLDYFIKAGFHYELKVQGSDTIFRENRRMNHIIADFFERFGGKFDYIIDKILEYSTELKLTKSKKPIVGLVSDFDPKSLNKVLIKCVDTIDEVMMSVMSDSLIDFCLEVCRCVNTTQNEGQESVTGENIVCSFIIFRIFAPRLLEHSCCQGVDLEKIKATIKGLCKIVIGETCLPKRNADKFISTQNERFRNVIARALMRHREVNYCYSVPLSAVKYAQFAETLLEGASRLKETETSLFKFLLQSASGPRRVTSIASELKYFLLWSAKEVLSVVRIEELNEEFFTRWNLTGADFIELNKETLEVMGMEDQEEIKKTLRCLSDIKGIALREKDLFFKGVPQWSVKDVSVWLILSGMADLVDLCQTYTIDGKALCNLEINDLCKMGIRRPKEIMKLMQFVESDQSVASE